jgi:hypothetical protein
MWLINITISLSSFAHESHRVAICKRFVKFLQAPGKILKEKMKQHHLKSEVPAIGRLLSLRPNFCAP